MRCLRLLSKEFERGENRFELEVGNVKAMRGLLYRISKGLSIRGLQGRDLSLQRARDRSLSSLSGPEERTWLGSVLTLTQVLGSIWNVEFPGYIQERDFLLSDL